MLSSSKKDIGIYVLINIIANASFLYAQNWNLHGKPGDGYYLTVNIGEPPQNFNLLIDTGSSNLAIAGSSDPGVESFYKPSQSKTYKESGTVVEVAYTQGWWKGSMGQDIVQIPSFNNTLPGVVTDLSIINSTQGFYVNNSHWQGILGLAYSKIAKPEGVVKSWFDTVTTEYPTIVGNRFDLELCGPKKYPNRRQHVGRISVGNRQAICQKSNYSTPIHHQWYYEVIVTQFKVGNNNVMIPCPDFNSPKTIIDSGTSNLQLSSKSYEYVIREIKSQTKSLLSEEFWAGKEPICFESRAKLSKIFPTLTIFLKHDNYSHFGVELHPFSYLRPALNYSDNPFECWLLGIEISHIGTVLGTVLLEGLCLVFDREQSTIHFSLSSCGPSLSFLPIVNKTDILSCSYTIHIVNGPSVAALIILLVVLLPLAVAFSRFIWQEFFKQKAETNAPFLSLDESNT